MKGIVVFAVMLGVIGIFFQLLLDKGPREYREAEEQVLAANFALFRNAALLYAHNNPSVVGEVSRNRLVLPNGWQPMRNWRCRSENNRWYVFGPANSNEIEAIRDLYKTSFALGRKQKGVLYPVHSVAVPLPGWIPEGNIVSLIEVH